MNKIAIGERIIGEISVADMPVGREVQYGWLIGRKGAYPLTGVVGYKNLESGEVEIIRCKNNRVTKVLLDPKCPVVDRGIPEEVLPKYRVVVPGID